MKSAVLTTFAATAALALSACGDDERTATAETSVAEAEVSTEMPVAAVSDAQLEASANRAAADASQPPEGALTPNGETGNAPTATTTEPAQ
jgi:peptidylprolyl isomerase